MKMNARWVRPSFLYDHRHSPDATSSEEGFSQAVEVVKEYIDENFRETVNLDDLAALVGLTRFSLAKQFRQRVGVSPYRYVCQVRILTAKSMMENGWRPIEVASEVGFFDQSHLARHFKRMCGVTPHEYRKSCTRALWGKITEHVETRKTDHC